MPEEEMAVLSIESAPDELSIAVKEFFPLEEWDHAVSISWLESGWTAFAEADTTQGGAIACGTIVGHIGDIAIAAEHSIGWFQIDVCNFPDWEWGRLFNTRHNVGTAHLLWSHRGWQPWLLSAKQLGLL